MNKEDLNFEGESMKKIGLIYNANAGQNKFKASLDNIIKKLCEVGFEVSIFRTTKGVSIKEFIKNSKDCYALIVAGGDGTINKVVNIMMKESINIPLGIIPAGTSNDFARHIGMTGSFEECLNKILKGNIQKVDVGLVNEEYYINVLSAGVFASSSYKTDKRLKDTFGHASYFLTAAKQPFTYKPFTLKIEIEDKIVIEEKTAVFIIFNGSSVGRIDKFSKGSSIQDGKLDLFLLRACKLPDLIKLIGKIEDKEYLDDDNIVYVKAEKFKITLIEGDCDRPDIDGDIGPDFPLDVRCIKDALKIFM